MLQYTTSDGRPLSSVSFTRVKNNRPLQTPMNGFRLQRDERTSALPSAHSAVWLEGGTLALAWHVDRQRQRDGMDKGGGGGA